ncbi:hypothetical protein L3Q82_011939, partial [Scortum barcoo]
VECGGYLQGISGFFYSPNYPNNYPNNVNCTWYIRASKRIVQLEFLNLSIESHPSCAYDAIYVYDGSSTNSRLLGKVPAEMNAAPRLAAALVLQRCQYRGDCCADYEGKQRWKVTNYIYSRNVVSQLSRHVVTTAAATWEAAPAPALVNTMATVAMTTTVSAKSNKSTALTAYCQTTTHHPFITTAQPSCRYNCGSYMGSCSCSSSCRYNGNCCHDYHYYCSASTVNPYTTPQPSCRYNCGSYMGSSPAPALAATMETVVMTTTITAQHQLSILTPHLNPHVDTTAAATWEAAPAPALAATMETVVMTTTVSVMSLKAQQRSRCTLRSQFLTNGILYHTEEHHSNINYCSASTVNPYTTPQPSCRYNCGSYMGSCSCSSSCRYNGNCCHDYHCKRHVPQSSAEEPLHTTITVSNKQHPVSQKQHTNINYCSATTVNPYTTAQPSCRYNCGSYMGSCSCSSSCQYYGNCCHDYYCKYSYCSGTTNMPTTASPCGGFLFGSGNFSSPNHPNYYYDNAYCVWQIRASYDQRIFLSFTYLQLENCCSCDYISVYDGPSVGSKFLGKVCNNSLSTFYSSSNYMTVLFRTDGSVVGRGFSATFISSLPPSSGRVDCSSDNMNIVVARSYLNSLGYDGHSLYLNDPHCRPQISSYNVVFSFPINTCGNIRKFENGRIVYTNTLRAYTSNFGEITRQSHLKISVGCRMDQDSVSQIMYVVHHRDNSSITGTGRYNTTMDFYTSSSFYYKVTQVPYEVKLNQDLYVQVNLRRGDSSLVLFLDTCVTSPSPHDFHTRPYYLVRNGCSMDNTYYSYSSGTSAYARFRFKAFMFLRATEAVYIQCKVLICPASDYNSRCRRGCNGRVARDLGSEHDSQTLVLGPIQLKGL